MSKSVKIISKPTTLSPDGWDIIVGEDFDVDFLYYQVENQHAKKVNSGVGISSLRIPFRAVKELRDNLNELVSDVEKDYKDHLKKLAK